MRIASALAGDDPRGPLSVTRAAYRLDLSDDDWMQALTDTAGRFVDFGVGVVGVLYEVDGETVAMRARKCFSREQLRDDYPFTDFSPMDVSPDVRLAAFGMNSPCSTARRIVAAAPGGLSLAALLERQSGPANLFDAFGLVGVDPSGHGALLTSPSAGEIKWPEARFELWARVSIHIGTAIRLRRALRAAVQAEPPTAVLDEQARLLHSDNTNSAFCELLRQSARVVLRSPRTERETIATMVAWRALVAGELSLVDTFDTDGKRLIIARRNRPLSNDTPNDPLSERERHVVEYARLGHPNKLIAYALGISTSTVATHLRSAQRKLGVTNRVALINALTKNHLDIKTSNATPAQGPARSR